MKQLLIVFLGAIKKWYNSCFISSDRCKSLCLILQADLYQHQLQLLLLGAAIDKMRVSIKWRISSSIQIIFTFRNAVPQNPFKEMCSNSTLNMIAMNLNWFLDIFLKVVTSQFAKLRRHNIIQAQYFRSVSTDWISQVMRITNVSTFSICIHACVCFFHWFHIYIDAIWFMNM